MELTESSLKHGFLRHIHEDFDLMGLLEIIMASQVSLMTIQV